MLKVFIEIFRKIQFIYVENFNKLYKLNKVNDYVYFL